MFSNEGFSHGHALAFTTTVAHKFNNSQFYERFKKLVEHFNFDPIHLTQNLSDAAKIIQLDKKHLDNNPLSITTENIIDLLELVNSQKSFVKIGYF